MTSIFWFPSTVKILLQILDIAGLNLLIVIKIGTLAMQGFVVRGRVKGRTNVFVKGQLESMNLALCMHMQRGKARTSLQFRLQSCFVMYVREAKQQLISVDILFLRLHC